VPDKQLAQLIAQLIREQTSDYPDLNKPCEVAGPVDLWLWICGSCGLDCLSGDVTRLCEAGRRQQACLTGEATQFCVSDMRDVFAGDVTTLECAADARTAIANARMLFIPAASRSLLSRMNTGLWDAPCAALVHEALTKSIPVRMSVDCLTSPDANCKWCGAVLLPEREQIANHLTWASRLGIEVVPRKELVTGLACSDKSIAEPPMRGSLVLTAEDIKDIDLSTGMLPLPGGTVISPLARDLLDEKGIKIIWKSDEIR
jgi:hypothetical protein